MQSMHAQDGWHAFLTTTLGGRVCVCVWRPDTCAFTHSCRCSCPCPQAGASCGRYCNATLQVMSPAICSQLIREKMSELGCSAAPLRPTCFVCRYNLYSFRIFLRMRPFLCKLGFKNYINRIYSRSFAMF